MRTSFRIGKSMVVAGQVIAAGGSHGLELVIRQAATEMLAGGCEPDPAIINEYTDSDHLLEGNHWYHIKLVSVKGRVQYWIDGKLLFDYNDADPYTEGWFGFRTTLSRTAIKNFSYTKVVEPPFSEAPLHWIGNTPKLDRAVSFGVPFKQGEVTAKTALQLQSADGSAITSDQWTLAKWPDGSIKWLGVAAVVPGGTSDAKLVKVKKAETAENRLITEDAGSFIVNTGKVKAFIPKSGSNIIDALWVGDTKVGGTADLVATEGGRRTSSQ